MHSMCISRHPIKDCLFRAFFLVIVIFNDVILARARFSYDVVGRNFNDTPGRFGMQ